MYVVSSAWLSAFSSVHVHCLMERLWSHLRYKIKLYAFICVVSLVSLEDHELYQRGFVCLGRPKVFNSPKVHITTLHITSFSAFSLTYGVALLAPRLQWGVVCWLFIIPETCTVYWLLIVLATCTVYWLFIVPETCTVFWLFIVPETCKVYWLFIVSEKCRVYLGDGFAYTIERAATLMPKLLIKPISPSCNVLTPDLPVLTLTGQAVTK